MAGALEKHWLMLAGAGYAKAAYDTTQTAGSFRGVALNGGLEWLVASGIGLSLRGDGVVDPSNGRRFVGIGTVNVEFGPPY